MVVFLFFGYHVKLWEIAGLAPRYMLFLQVPFKFALGCCTTDMHVAPRVVAQQRGCVLSTSLPCNTAMRHDQRSTPSCNGSHVVMQCNVKMQCNKDKFKATYAIQNTTKTPNRLHKIIKTHMKC